jgi:hypothetical protein
MGDSGPAPLARRVAIDVLSAGAEDRGGATGVAASTTCQLKPQLAATLLTSAANSTSHLGLSRVFSQRLRLVSPRSLALAPAICVESPRLRRHAGLHEAVRAALTFSLGACVTP